MGWKAKKKAKCGVCGDEFWPAGPRHSTCAKTTCRAVRNKLWQAKSSGQLKGRTCRCCGANDGERSFGQKDLCKACSRALRLYGPCPECGGPLRKVRNDYVVYCPGCREAGRSQPLSLEGPDGTVYWTRSIAGTKTTIPVTTHYARDYKRYYAKKGTAVVCEGQTWELEEVIRRVGSVHLVQSKKPFNALTLDDVLCIRGITEPSFPRDLPLISSPTFNMFYEMAHYCRLGECDTVRFAWWANKFKPDIETGSAERAWDRFKVKLRSVGVPLTVQPGKAFTFDKPREFVRGVMDAATSASKREKSAWT